MLPFAGGVRALPAPAFNALPLFPSILAAWPNSSGTAEAANTNPSAAVLVTKSLLFIFFLLSGNSKACDEYFSLLPL
jgi:hypothetical protein